MSQETQNWTIDDAEDLYGVKRWGAGYFSIGGAWQYPNFSEPS